MVDALTSLRAGFLGSIRDPGPFCSQLVGQLLEQQGLAASKRPAARMAPIDLEHSDEFIEVDCAIEVAPSPAPTRRGRDIEKLLDFNATPTLSPVFADFSQVIDLAVFVEQTGSWDFSKVKFREFTFAKDETIRLENWCNKVSGVFWSWYRQAPACFATCADKKRERTTATENTMVWKLATARCNDIYECSLGSGMPFLEKARRNLDEIMDRV
jgi:hypothetical protein